MTEWRKSTRSGVQGQSDCVELTRLEGGIGVRDSKNPAAGHLTVSAASFGELLGRIRSGKYL
jgi:hypothetical protein